MWSVLPSAPANVHCHSVRTRLYRSSRRVSSTDSSFVDLQPAASNSCFRLGIASIRSLAFTTCAPLGPAIRKEGAYIAASVPASAAALSASKRLKNASTEWSATPGDEDKEASLSTSFCAREQVRPFARTPIEHEVYSLITAIEVGGEDRAGANPPCQRELGVPAEHVGESHRDVHEQPAGVERQIDVHR